MTALMMRGGLCCSLGNVLIVLKAHRCIFYTTTSNIALTFEFPQAELIRKRADDFFLSSLQRIHTLDLASSVYFVERNDKQIVHLP